MLYYFQMYNISIGMSIVIQYFHNYEMDQLLSVTIQSWYVILLAVFPMCTLHPHNIYLSEENENTNWKKIYVPLCSLQHYVQ